MRNNNLKNIKPCIISATRTATGTKILNIETANQDQNTQIIVLLEYSVTQQSDSIVKWKMTSIV